MRVGYVSDVQPGNQPVEGRQIMSYIRRLEDQVRYALANLDGQSIQAGSVGEEQLSKKLSRRVTAAEEKAESTAQDAAKAKKQIAALQASLRANREAIAALLTGAAMKEETSAAFTLYVGQTRPDGHGIVWIQPRTAQGGAAECLVQFIE